MDFRQPITRSHPGRVRRRLERSSEQIEILFVAPNLEIEIVRTIRSEITVSRHDPHARLSVRQKIAGSLREAMVDLRTSARRDIFERDAERLLVELDALP
jgi:hypothetical protein